MTANAPGEGRILAINSGSSSLKFALYAMRPREAAVLSGKLDRIGAGGRGDDGAGAFAARDERGETVLDRRLDLPDHAAAIRELLNWLGTHSPAGGPPVAVGHRIVHGGAMSKP